MYPFRIGYDRSPSTKFLPWASHMETFQLTMTSTLNYLGVTKDATMAVELSTTQFWVCQEANSQFCSITTPFQPLANPPSSVSALYARSPADITPQCSLQIRKITTWTMPISVSLCKILTSFLCRHHGFEWHFWFWRHHDNVQQWGYTITWGCSVLRNSGLHWTLYWL